MNKNEVFNILGIEETDNTDIITKAYRDKLAFTNPEDDAEGFKLLRQAYEQAMEYANEQEDKSPVGLWLKSVKEVYFNYNMRLDKWAWEELFEDEVCTDAGTFNHARLALFRFFMEHYYLPNFVFEMLETYFKLTEDFEELAEELPADFLSFLQGGGIGMNMEIIQGEDGETVDKACALNLAMMRANNSGNDELFEQLKEEYIALNVRVPYIDVNLAARAAKNNEPDVAKEYLKNIEYAIDIDGGVAVRIADTYIELGEIERAEEISKATEEKFGSSLNLQVAKILIRAEKGELSEAKKDLESIYEKNQNENIFSRLQDINEKLIADYTSRETTFAEKLELGWCYYQNEYNEKLMELCDSITPGEEDDKAMYYNLRSRALMLSERLDECLEAIEKWREELIAQNPQTEKEINDRKRRMVLSAFLKTRAYRLLNNKENNKEYLEKAMEAAQESTVCEEKPVMIQFIMEKIGVLMDMERYDEAIDSCNALINDDENCLPAYIMRQQCSFKLKKASSVLEDYENIMDRVPNLDYSEPYALAAHVFVIYDRYDQALNIIGRAESNNAKGEYLDYVKASALRYKATCKEDTREALDILNAVARKIEEETSELDKERKLLVYEEICYAYMDLEEWEDAIKAVNKAIALEPENYERNSIKFDIYAKSDDKKGFEKEVKALQKVYGKYNPFILYSGGKFYEKRDIKKALAEYLRIKETVGEYKDVDSRLREVYLRLYYMAFSERNFYKALEYADLEISRNPYGKQYFDRALVYMARNMLPEAESDLKKSLEFDEESIMSNEWLGDALRGQGKHEEALKYYKEAYELARGNGNYYPLKDYALGLECAGEYEKAIEIIKELIDSFPDELFAWRTLARLYTKSGDYEAAYNTYIQCMEKYGADLSVGQKCDKYRDIIDFLPKLPHHIAEVETDLNKLVKKFSKESDAYYALAYFYTYIKKDYKKCIKSMNKAILLAKNKGDTVMAERYLRFATELMLTFGKNKSPLLLMSLGTSEPEKFNFEKDERYKKIDYYSIGMYYYLRGKKDKAFSLFKKMQEGYCCPHCAYSCCVEMKISQALMLAEKGDTETAVEYLKSVQAEVFDMPFMSELIKYIKEKK